VYVDWKSWVNDNYKEHYVYQQTYSREVLEGRLSAWIVPDNVVPEKDKSDVLHAKAISLQKWPHAIDQ